MAGPSRSRYRATDGETLGELWRSWHDAGRGMPAGLWATPCGLGDWTVRELYAHVGRGVSTLAGMITRPTPLDRPDLSDAAAYFAAVRSLDADQVARTARDWAAERTDEVLVDAFGATAATVLAALPAPAIARSVAGTIRVADFAVTRILEATVHLLDLGAVAPHAGVPTPDALRRTVDVLADLTPPAEFVLAATGRPSPPVFPVLT